MKVYVLESDFGQGDDNRTFLVGVYSTLDKAEAKKREIEENVKKILKRKPSAKSTGMFNHRYYDALDFNFCQITEFELL